MKTRIGPVNALYPTPTTLVGATVNGKPNFITIAHVGIMTFDRISLGMGKAHYTNAGIKENGTFSVCLPSEALVKETDYCGIMTGKHTDKAALFTVFYGDLKTAPMIQECPVCMECRLDRVIDYTNHDIFIGEITQTYVDESALTNGAVDISKVRPLLFDMSGKEYWALGKPVARCWHVGKELKKKG